VAHVAEKEAAGWGDAEALGIGVDVFLFRWDDVGVIRGSAADGLDVDVGELDVFDEMAGDASEDGSLAGRVVALEVADEDALEGSDLGGFFGTAKTAAETQEERATDEIAHGGVGDGDVFKQSAIHALERVAVAALEDAVGDGDVDEATV